MPVRSANLFCLRAALAASLIGLAAPITWAQTPPRLVVTDAMLASLQAMSAWGAHVIGGPGPGPDFIARERERLTAQSGRLAPAQVAALSEAPRTLAVVEHDYALASPRWKQAFLRKARATFADRPDPTEPYRLAEAVAGLGADWSRTGGPPAFEAKLHAQTNAALSRMRGISNQTNSTLRGMQAQHDSIMRSSEYGCMGFGGDPEYRNSPGYCTSSPGTPNVSGGAYGR